VLIGLNTFQAKGSAGQRQDRAVRHNLEIQGISLVNLDFATQPESPSWEGLRSLEVLQTDSRKASGCKGPRKPIIPELLNELHRVAEREDHLHFGLCNADIRLTPEAVQCVKRSQADSMTFSRTDCELIGSNTGTVCLYGLDFIVIKTSIWPRIRTQVRPYILGESLWDNVLCALLAAQSRFEHIDTEGLVLHEAHPRAWEQSPFARYVWWLSVLDGAHFSRWCSYVAQREVDQANTAECSSPATKQSAIHLLSRPWPFKKRCYFATRACYYLIKCRREFRTHRFF
jgi:hypothetical protein